jgi:ribosome-binding protein aMBF1 (putative translation factor)
MNKEEIRSYLAEYGEKMREARKNKKLAQWEVASDIGVNQTIICYIEQGFYFPSEYLEQKLLKEYGIEKMGV